MERFGTVRINLTRLIEENGIRDRLKNLYLVVSVLKTACSTSKFWGHFIFQTRPSKNKLSQRAEMQWTQINHYCNNTITRLDIDVLARLCTVLECEISDLLEFVPPKEN